jgi:uncharacterized membrane protein
MNRLSKNRAQLKKSAENATQWIGSTGSLIVHTIIFIASFVLVFLGVPLDRVLLVLTTAVSLEAIYLAIFIQMTVNKNTADIEEIQEDVEDIAEDVGEMEKDVDEIQKDVDEIQKDVDEIQEDVEEIEEDTEKIAPVLKSPHPEILEKIQHVLEALAKDVEALKNKEK